MYLHHRTNRRTPAAPHWSEGGSGITNFGTEKLPIYTEAIVASGMEDVLYVELRPMAGGGENCDYYSLHYRPFARRGDLTTFWKFWKLAEKLHEMRLGYIESLTKANLALTEAVREQESANIRFKKSLEVISEYHALCEKLMKRAY